MKFTLSSVLNIRKSKFYTYDIHGNADVNHAHGRLLPYHKLLSLFEFAKILWERYHLRGRKNE